MTGMRNVTFLVAMLFVSGCSDPLAHPGADEAAQQHLVKLVDIMELNSINRNTIDWPAFRNTVTSAASEPRDLGDTFGAIHLALGLLNDNHSSYTAPAAWGQVINNTRVTCTAPAAAPLEIPTDIGYVRVSAVTGSAAIATSAARSLQQTIRLEDTPEPIGWIVDLRGNTGGNLWPMIAGLGPILGEGTLGWFIDPDAMASRWEYRGGLSILNGLTMQAVETPYTLKQADPKVAVLIDGRVASSGEATAIAFKGRPDTRFFGTPTCGLSTANTQFNVDGATLNLTVAVVADRNKFAFGDTLRPDEVLSDASALRDRAIAWIRGATSRVALTRDVRFIR